MNILVSGGLGFIGSHTCVALLNAGYSVVAADNLANSSCDAADSIQKITGKSLSFYNIDVTDECAVDRLFGNNKIDCVIHFAGLKSVSESTREPLLYYRNNIGGTLVLASACLKHGVNKFVFSSSATVYGDRESPFAETMEVRHAANPYGETKIISEKILTDTAKANPSFSVSLLRYFNPVGAHESGMIGENPNGTPQNLMPLIVRTAANRQKTLKIFGCDYDTPDGTCIRDYVHVMDLAEGHVAALNGIKRGTEIYNLGTGRGTSVMELVHTFERVNGIKVPYEMAERRAGDIAAYYADVSKAERELKWKAQRGTENMCRDSWLFAKKFGAPVM